MIQLFPIDTVHFLCCLNLKKNGCNNIMVAEMKKKKPFILFVLYP